MKACVFTLGCKVNSCESSSLMRGLSELGYTVSGKLCRADLYIINTCAVTKEAEKKSRQAIARAKKYSPDAKIIVTGCASQKSPESFLNKDGVYLVTGAINKDKIIDILDQNGVFIDDSKEYYRRFYPLEVEKVRYYLKIQDGCDNFCSYCIIPYLRGRSRSRDIADVISELDGVTASEVVVTGINLSAYSYEGKKLPDLISALKKYRFRIRLGSLEDNVVSNELVSALKSLYDFAPHFHLSLQSGSDDVLKKMNRHYTTEAFADSVELIRRNFPDAAVTTDVIVGYPVETDEDFEKTYDFCKKIAFSDIHCFEYSPREGTVGYKLKQLAPDVKKRRLDRLIGLKYELKKAYIEKYVGKSLSFIVEELKNGYSVGYSANYIRVYVSGRLPVGEKIDVLIKSSFEDGAIAEIVK
ncbi:MAG: tRNA (N(6)-L-threonylcarbamoyladenosine(37)-C(2))-methylthiotransferase MtaB [Clostridia bacterium]|nr:tRNA (N(6)-L-threonylcarbamoyladenosine(37)-C(2))-methylthiotransferase MtaB [Clostridia bacterium]